MRRFALFTAAWLACAGAAFAQEAADATGAVAPQGRPLSDLIAAGGLIGHLIIACSIAGLAVALECWMRLRREKLCPPELVADLERLLDDGRYDDALAVCEGNRCYIANVVGTAVARAGEGYAAAVEGMQGALDKENLRCMQKISFLSLLGGLGPMLGLTGTVTGMIAAFGVIELIPQPSPAQLARGIYEALVTTAEGLFLAIPILTVYFVLKNRVQAMALEFADVAGGLVGRLQTAENR